MYFANFVSSIFIDRSLVK